MTTKVKTDLPGTKVIIDPSLPERTPDKSLAVASTLPAIYDYDKGLLVKSINGEIKHNNYLTYLIYAYRYHLGYVFSPDILWHLIISQVSKYVVDNAEDFRGIYNGNQDGTKKTLEITMHNIQDMSGFCDKLISLLEEEVFFDVSMFDGDFSTTTKEARLNYMTGLLESGSPFYDYIMMFACGFPTVQLQGEVSDFVKIQDKIKKLKDTFGPLQNPEFHDKYDQGRKSIKKDGSYSKDLNTYFDQVHDLIGEIIDNYLNPKAEFWKGILRTDATTRRGYDDLTKDIEAHRSKLVTDDDFMAEELLHDYVTGWISKLNLNFGREIDTINQRLISKFDFKLLGTVPPMPSGMHTLYSGIFSSDIVDRTLVPEFGYFAVKKSEDHQKQIDKYVGPEKSYPSVSPTFMGSLFGSSISATTINLEPKKE